jgi:Ras-related protein Rab-18
MEAFGDTTGQERFRSLTTGYYRNAHAALIVYDITSTESLLNCERWMNDVNMYSGHDSLQYFYIA